MKQKFIVYLLRALIMSSLLANSRTMASNIIDAESVQASPEDLHQVKTLETNGSGQIGDAYIDSAQKSCLLSKARFSCAKFRALRYIHELTSPFENEWNAGSSFLTNGFTLFGSISLVPIPASRSSLQSGVLFEGLLDTSPGPEDTELISFLKFTGREMQRFVRSYAVTMKVPVSPMTYSERAFGGDLPRLIDLDEDARELKEEPRLKKKHLLLLIPLGFMHMKLLILPILLIVLFIKKVIMIVILFLPTVLSWLRVCRKDHGPHWLIPESHSEPHHEPEIYASHTPVHHYEATGYHLDSHPHHFDDTPHHLDSHPHHFDGHPHHYDSHPHHFDDLSPYRSYHPGGPDVSHHDAHSIEVIEDQNEDLRRRWRTRGGVSRKLRRSYRADIKSTSGLGRVPDVDPHLRLGNAPTLCPPVSPGRR